MRRLGCPESFDADLARLTLHAAQRMVDSGQAIASVPAWTTQAFRRRALDLLKAPAHRARDPLNGGDLDGAGLVAPTDEIDEVLARIELDDIRRRVGARPGADHSADHGWVMSAALSFLAIAVEGCAAGPRCPAPLGGAGEFEAAHWAALHYAGAAGCFATPGSPDTPAIRQRRKRRIDTVRAALADAYTATHPTESGGSGDA
jgi:hypothetical protein